MCPRDYEPTIVAHVCPWNQVLFVAAHMQLGDQVPSFAAELAHLHIWTWSCYTFHPADDLTSSLGGHLPLAKPVHEGWKGLLLLQIQRRQYKAKRNTKTGNMKQPEEHNNFSN